MKKIVLLLLLGIFLTPTMNSQELKDYKAYDENESRWSFGGKEHQFTMNYTLFGKSFANGLWQGSLGYATGMWLSGNKTGWGIVGSIVAVNVPILLDKDYNKGEVWVGKNLGAILPSIGVTIYVELNRDGKMTWNIPMLIRKR